MSTGEPGPRYTFGDTPLAARRLLRVANVFESPSRSFLQEEVTRPPRVALDVGCGPGATTRLLAEVTRARQTVGLDASPAFVDLAKVDAPSGVIFEMHDVTQLPLPHAPADLVYCRLLLAHLPDIEGMIDGFTSQLTVAGRLLVDEIEWIDTDHPVLAAYERVVVDLVASQGAPMYAGPIVDRLQRGRGWVQRSSRVRVVSVETGNAARMFEMNIATWRDHPHIRANYTAAEIDHLTADLRGLADAPGTGAITWGVRQAVFERI